MKNIVIHSPLLAERQIRPDIAHEVAERRVDPSSSNVEPVLASLVLPTPSPLRFGLRAMMALMVICSFQFALMNWFGVLYGLMTSFAICFLAFSLLFTVAVAFVRGDSVWLDRLDQIGIRLVVAMTVLVISSVFAGGGTLAFQELAKYRLASGLESDLGIQTSRVTIVSTAGGKTEFLQGRKIDDVIAGGEGNRAGLQQDDILVLRQTEDEFYQLLDQQRGKTVDLAVTRGADVQPLENCQQWTITLPIPK